MDERYGNFDLRSVDWDAAWEQWSLKVSADSDDDELWAAITGMLAITDDGHVQMLRPGEEHWSANAVFRDEIGDDRFDLDVVKDSYLEDIETSNDGGATWGTLPDGTPYVYFAYVAQNMRAIEDVLDAHPDARVLVIDMRHNGGATSPGRSTNSGCSLVRRARCSGRARATVPIATTSRRGRPGRSSREDTTATSTSSCSRTATRSVPANVR